MKIRLNKLPDWVGKTATALPTLIAAAGLWFAGVQIHDGHKVQAAQFALQFDERLTKPGLIAVVDAAYNPHSKILKEHGGVSSDDELEELLGDYETLYYLHKDGLVSDELMENLFCNDIKAVNGNAEVQAYVLNDQKTADKDDYAGFGKLATLCTTWDRNGKGHRLAQ